MVTTESGAKPKWPLWKKVVAGWLGVCVFVAVLGALTPKSEVAAPVEEPVSAIRAEAVTPAPETAVGAANDPYIEGKRRELAALERALDAGTYRPSLPRPPAGFACPDVDPGNGCLAGKLSLLAEDWPRAWAGDYQGQRNVAYCLTTGCDGAVVQNPVQGCAWRMVILASGHAEVHRGDTGNAEVECGRLDEVELAAARSRAAQIARQIESR